MRFRYTKNRRYSNIFFTRKPNLTRKSLKRSNSSHLHNHTPPTPRLFSILIQNHIHNLLNFQRFVMQHASAGKHHIPVDSSVRLRPFVRTLLPDPVLAFRHHAAIVHLPALQLVCAGNTGNAGTLERCGCGGKHVEDR
jgi:hypothetical protein